MAPEEGEVNTERRVMLQLKRLRLENLLLHASLRALEDKNTSLVKQITDAQKEIVVLKTK